MTVELWILKFELSEFIEISFWHKGFKFCTVKDQVTQYLNFLVKIVVYREIMEKKSQLGLISNDDLYQWEGA